MTRKQKSAEIQRFLQLLDALNETPATLEEKTGISARTINNYIWGDTPLGGSLLRALANVFSVSVDWLMTGCGEMFTESVPANHSRFLLPFFETIDANTVQDFWWLAARAVEESLRQSGAVAGDDYGYVDLYQLSQPLVAAKFAAGELVLQANDSA
jgi:transcriptional regulator with XRE-family HTH domain